ncbi:MAG: hypothetical protein Q8L09_02380 [Candidatus Moranbacteria bacterium]|nr:hypothetical protein [Candidatus Moranbacteria bacterium]
MCGVLAVVFLILFAFPAPGKAEEGNFFLKWGKKHYRVVYCTDFQSDQTHVQIFLKSGGKLKKVISYTEHSAGIVEPVRNFFGAGKDAIVFSFTKGSSAPELSYLVMQPIRGGIKFVKEERDIPNGFLRVSGDIIEIWSGVTMSIAHWNGQAAVKERPLTAVIIPTDKKINDRIITFRIEGGKVEIISPENHKQGIRLKSGFDLLFIRSDINDDSDRIEFDGSVAMTIKHPNTFTFSAPGKREIRIVPNGDPKGEARIPLEVF